MKLENYKLINKVKIKVRSLNHYHHISKLTLSKDSFLISFSPSILNKKIPECKFN